MSEQLSSQGGRTSPALVLALLCLFATTLIGWLWIAPPKRTAAETPGGRLAIPEVRRSPETPPALLTPPSASASESNATAAPGGAAGRMASTPSKALLRGRLLDSSNEPIGDARLTWTGWGGPTFDGPHAARLVASAEAIEHWTVRTTSAPDGTFAFFEAPPFDPESRADGAPQSALWVLSIGHLALGKYLVGESPSDLEDLVLEAAEPIEVQVFNGTQPANGAKLELWCARYPEPVEWDQLHPAWLLRLTATTDEQGRARLAQLPFDIHVEASLGTRISPAYEGPSEDPITLQLGPASTIAGHVTLAPWNPDLGDPRITVSAVRDHESRRLISSRLDAELNFGPLALPVLEADEYIARIEGGGFIPSETAFPPPSEGEAVRLELEAHLGAMTWLGAFVQPGKQYLREATATITWPQAGRQISATFHANPDGYILASGLPEGTVSAILTAPGYTQSSVTPFHVPELPEPALHDIALFPVRRLEGTCVSASGPVEDFELFYWWSVDQGMHATASVRGAEQGRFELDNAFPGEMGIFAFAPGLGASPRVMLQADETEVRLELAPYRTVVGRVIGPDDLPILTARVHLVTLNGEYPMQAFGVEQPVDSDGRFVLDELPPQPVQVLVEAPNFSTRVARAEDLQSPIVELGDLRLVPRQTLTIHADTLPGAIARAATIDGTTIPRTPLDPSGDLVVPDMDAGPCLLYVSDDSRGWAQWRTVTLEPDQDWRIDFAFRGGEAVQIQAVPKDGKRLPAEPIWVSSTRRGLHNEPIQDTFFLDEDGRFTIQGMGPGLAVFELESHATGETGMGSIRIEAGAGPHVLTIPFGAETWRVHVADSSGAPLEGARVALYGPTPAAPFTSRVTNPTGDVSFPDLGPAYVLAAITTAEGGLALDLPFTAPVDPDRPTALTVDVDAYARLTLTEAGLPQEGLLVSYTSEAPELAGQGLSATSDSSGNVTLGRLTPGPKRLSILGTNLWSVDTVIEATPDGPPTPVEVYHLGQLDLRFQHDDGTPATGLVIELIHTGLEESVATWIAEERDLTSSSPSLTTDAQGRLALAGIPRGGYLWQAAGIAGTLQTSPSGITLVVPIK